jgi:hypothetical protein
MHTGNNAALMLRGLAYARDGLFRPAIAISTASLPDQIGVHGPLPRATGALLTLVFHHWIAAAILIFIRRRGSYSDTWPSLTNEVPNEIPNG